MTQSQKRSKPDSDPDPHPRTFEQALSEAIELYKDCLGIRSNLKLLADSSFLKFLRATDKKSSADALEHLNIAHIFGVDSVECHTTQCVISQMPRDIKPARLKTKWSDVVSFALTIPHDCPHCPPKPLDSGMCIQHVLEEALPQPYVYASTKHDRVTKLWKMFGVPGIWIRQGVPVVYPPEVGEKGKEQLQALKEKRIMALENFYTEHRKKCRYI